MRAMAGWMQWVIYLAGATFSGLLWYPVGLRVKAVYFPHDPFADRNLWIWLFLTGLISGLLYRAVTRWRHGQEPTHWWFAALVPSIAVFACISVLAYGGDREASYGRYLFLYLLVGNATAYVALGWLLIPLAVPYALLLGWLHRASVRLGAEAKPRHLRHFAWGVVSFGLLAAWEAPRLPRYWVTNASGHALGHLNLDLPEGAEMVASGEGFGGDGSFWFRLIKPPKWPLVPDQAPLSHPEAKDLIKHRAAEKGIQLSGGTIFNQSKWYRNGRTVQATWVQTPQSHYLEIIPW
jgi:hypothetical protein